MKRYEFSDFEGDVKSIAKKIKNFNPDVLLAISRGGMTLGHSLAVALDMRNLFSLNSIHYDGEVKLKTLKVFNIPDLSDFKRVVLVDDIVDSGESMAEICKILKEKFPHIELKIATIYYKPTAIIQPDFTVREADDWIDFFWDIRL